MLYLMLLFLLEWNGYSAKYRLNDQSPQEACIRVGLRNKKYTGPLVVWDPDTARFLSINERWIETISHYATRKWPSVFTPEVARSEIVAMMITISKKTDLRPETAGAYIMVRVIGRLHNVARKELKKIAILASPLRRSIQEYVQLFGLKPTAAELVFFSKAGRWPTIVETFEISKAEIEKMNTLLAKQRKFLDLNRKIGAEDGEALGSLIEDTRSVRPGTFEDQSETSLWFHKILAKLSSKESYIVYHHLILDEPLSQIAKQLKISRSGANLAFDRAIENIKKLIKASEFSELPIE